MALRDQMTAEELLGVEMPGKRIELVRGRLVVREPAGLRHGGITARIAAALSSHLARERERERAQSLRLRGHVLTADPGFTVARNPDTVRAPDVAYLSVARFPGPLPTGFGERAPDLAVEVRSPNDRPGELLEKVADWLKGGASLVWDVDPARDVAHVYRADGTQATLHAHESLDGEELLPGFSLPLRDVFATGD